MSENASQGALEIVKLFAKNGEDVKLPFCETATVVKPLPNIEIRLRDITYKKKQIKLDEYWVKGHEREIEIPDAELIGVDSHGDSHITGRFPKAKIIFKDELKAGDEVAVLQSRDKQTLYVLFRIGRL